MFLKTMSRAMRYYRFWIYSCNISLLIATIIYTIAFICIINDNKMLLIKSIRLYQPTFLYNYCAIILQGGVLQTIGCIGALRLNENLLNLYLLLMIALLFGDGLVGIVWISRFNTIVANLRTDLKSRLLSDYDIDFEFQDIWNQIQTDYQCCGVDGPYDYNNRTAITSTFITNGGGSSSDSVVTSDHLTMSNEVLIDDHYHQHHNQHQHQQHRQQVLPNSCCLLSSSSSSSSSNTRQLVEDMMTSSSSILVSQQQHNSQLFYDSGGGGVGLDTRCLFSSADSLLLDTDSHHLNHHLINYHQNGCYEPIHLWLQHSADLLSILGFCIITFVKILFLVILRYEIKEMIQKIKVLKSESPASGMLVPVQDLEAYLPRPSIVQQTQSDFMTSSSGGAATAAAQALLINAIPNQSAYHHYRSGSCCAAVVGGVGGGGLASGGGGGIDKHCYHHHHHVISTCTGGGVGVGAASGSCGGCMVTTTTGGGTGSIANTTTDKPRGNSLTTTSVGDIINVTANQITQSKKQSLV